MCMGSSTPPPPPPPPAPPPTLDQLAPKSAPSASDSDRKRRGLSRYKLPTVAPQSRTNKLGGIPKKTGI